VDQINIDSENDVVTLRGEVQTTEIRNLSESIARDVPGVNQVRNHLYVLQPVQ
jgi:osmotically-inducible protein OsmY